MNLSTYKDLDVAVLEHCSQERAEGTEVAAGAICAGEARYFFKALEFESEFSAASG
jgi:hypothetical protein